MIHSPGGRVGLSGPERANPVCQQPTFGKEQKPSPAATASDSPGGASSGIYWVVLRVRRHVGDSTDLLFAQAPFSPSFVRLCGGRRAGDEGESGSCSALVATPKIDECEEGRSANKKDARAPLTPGPSPHKWGEGSQMNLVSLSF